MSPSRTSNSPSVADSGADSVAGSITDSVVSTSAETSVSLTGVSFPVLASLLGLAGAFPARPVRATVGSGTGSRCRRAWRRAGAAVVRDLVVDDLGRLDVDRAVGAHRLLPRLRGELLAELADRLLLGLGVRVELVDVGLLAERPNVAGEPVQQHAEREDQAGEQHAERDEVQHHLLHGGRRTLRYGRLSTPDQDLGHERRRRTDDH